MLKEENHYSKEFENYTIDDNLYYLLLMYEDRNGFKNTYRKPLHMMTKEEVLSLMDDAFKYYKENGVE